MSTYEEIYERMKAAYAEKTGFKPVDASDTGLRFAVLAGEIYSLLCNCEWMQRQMFPDTATGKALDMHAAQRGLTRKGAGIARGVVRFTLSEPAESRISIQSNVILSTSGPEPVMFMTEGGDYMQPGDTEVNVMVRAAKGGRSGNAAKGQITNIVSMLPFNFTITNPEPFKGGTDEESDDELRLRVLDSYRNASNGTNKAYYSRLCADIEGVGSVGVIPRNRGAGTVDVFLAGQSTTASAEAVAQANSILSSAREVNVDAKAFAAKEKTVNLRVWVITDGVYTESDVSTRCIAAIRELIINSRVGEDILLSQIISRLMELDGVKDVMFSGSYDNISVPDDTKAVPGMIYIDFR